MKPVFPLKFKVTNEILDYAIPGDMTTCIGARALQAALMDCFYTRITWCAFGGHIYVKNRKYAVSTKEQVDMRKIMRPRNVTFIEA
jgi:hypothetical protein